MDFLREFFYVDVERARSYLAQLGRGVVESITERVTDEKALEAKASLFGVGGAGSIAKGAGREEARSLQDLTFVAFEELASDRGYIVDAEPWMSEPEAWLDSSVHGSLVEGQILRIRADIQILDASFFEARLSRMDAFAEAILGLTTPTPTETKGQQAQQQKKARETALRAARSQLWGGTDPSAVKSIADVFSSLMGQAIAIRVLPCGVDHPELSFGGALLDRRDYVQPEREALFGRYGAVLREWTCVMQIASLPTGPGFKEEDVDFGAIQLTGPDNRIKRASLERMATQFLGFMESMGMAEGPRWPSISVTPLAIYRRIPGGT